MQPFLFLSYGFLPIIPPIISGVAAAGQQLFHSALKFLAQMPVKSLHIRGAT